jgi:hypothetical protein
MTTDPETQADLDTLARINAAFNTEDDHHDLSVKDYNLLERMHKQDGATDDQAKHFEYGWEAAIIHLRKLLRG